MYIDLSILNRSVPIDSFAPIVARVCSGLLYAEKDYIRTFLDATKRATCARGLVRSAEACSY